MLLELNKKRVSALSRLDTLKRRGYKDRGWVNSGAKMNGPIEEELDLSMYARRSDHRVYISHVTKELVHVDMSD